MRLARIVLRRNIRSRRNLLNSKMAERKVQLLQDRKNFDEALPKVIEQVMLPPHNDTADAVEHLRKVNNFYFVIV